MSEPAAPARRLMEVSVVARRLNVSDEYIYKLLRRRQLVGIRLDSGRWRIDPNELELFLRRHATEGGTT